MHRLTVAADTVNVRLDIYLASALNTVSRSLIRRMIDSGNITVNGTSVKASFKVNTGDVICYEIIETETTDIIPQEIPIEIVYEDEYLIVINKPRGMAAHPAPGTPSGTVVNAILAHTGKLSSINGNERPGIVHRLDKDTSGLMMIARNDTVHRILQKQIQTRTAKRRYLALVWGNPKFEDAEVDAPIGRHPGDRKKMAVIKSTDHPSRDAVTEFCVLKRFGAFALLEARLQTGRTHQVRVHAAYAGHPVVGDPLYSGDRRLREKLPKFYLETNRLIDNLKGQALHAYALSFFHPITGKQMEFTTEPPAVMKSLIDYLESESGA